MNSPINKIHKLIRWCIYKIHFFYLHNIKQILWNQIQNIWHVARSKIALNKQRLKIWLLESPQKIYDSLAPIQVQKLDQFSPTNLRLRKGKSKYSLPDCLGISIVTPSLNQANYLESCITSILDQNFPNLEYVVMDGGSTDRSKDIIMKYINKLHDFSTSPDQGQSNAINNGFLRTSNEIMGWINSDDLMMPKSLKKISDYFKKNPNIDVIYGNRLVVNHDNKLIGKWVLPKKHEDNYLLWADYIPQETLFWRRSIWESSGGFIDNKFRFAMDWDLILRFRSCNAKFAHVSNLFGGFRVHKDQKTSSLIDTLGEQEMNLIRTSLHGKNISYQEINVNLIQFYKKQRLAGFFNKLTLNLI